VSATTDRSEETKPKQQNVVLGLIAAMRPKQWIKNILVLAAPFAAGQIMHPGVLVASLWAFVAFTMAAAGVYLVNDAKDVHTDRLHPKKKFRPIASGAVPVPVALGFGGVLLVGSLALTLMVSLQLLIVVAIYVCVQLGYCFGLKHQPVLEMCCVASGFLIRSIAGGVATHIHLSQWFLLVTAFGSLYMVAGKRHSERLLIDQGDQSLTRKVLTSYSPSYLRFVWALSATVMIVMYALWAFDIRHMSGSVWSVISIVPFVIAVLRYAVDVDSGGGGAPEDRVLGDRILQGLGLLWIMSLALAIYV
jgi:decaprenyl-phosphate phosphoribosyltransferase